MAVTVESFTCLHLNFLISCYGLQLMLSIFQEALLASSPSPLLFSRISRKGAWTFLSMKNESGLDTVLWISSGGREEFSIWLLNLLRCSSTMVLPSLGTIETEISETSGDVNLVLSSTFCILNKCNKVILERGKRGKKVPYSRFSIAAFSQEGDVQKSAFGLLTAVTAD